MSTRILLLFFLQAISISVAIGHEVSGKITDANDKPIRDAEVRVLNSSIHTHSNNLGEFLLKGVNTGDTLVVTHLSYEVQFVAIEALQNEILIQLEPNIFELTDVVVNPEVGALNVVTQIDLETTPVRSSQEILMRVPGLIIGQHAGGGKAEQIFLRGFDIDHGTDIAIAVDGLPVNMVSHAHGQGYADLHFIIPETIENIDFGKGAYYADKGNFSTAGYVDFNTKDRLDANSLQFELGQFNYLRTVGLLDIVNTEKHSAYIASEFVSTDGFFDSPQNFNRINLFGKYTAILNDHDKLSILASYFDSKWDASGQIPTRAVNQGLISRFGAIDDTEGGFTGRKNLKIDYTKSLSHQSFIKNSVLFSQYDFELYSNFTFLLEDPENGDQIRQRENRNIIGVSSVYNRSFSDQDNALQLGAGLRNDQAKETELSRSKDRITTLEQIQFGDINETNVYAFANVEFKFGKWLINPGLRLDYFESQYYDRLLTPYQTQSATAALVSPKLNFLYNYSSTVQAYIKLGTGFHSNDTRVVVAQNGREILPASYGGDIGLIWKPFPRLFLNAAAWYLYLEQEFVYVGDAGIVEPSGATRRFGLDFSLRYQLTDWLHTYIDINTADAKSILDEGTEYIPLAPSLTSSGGLSVNHPSGFSGGLRYRFIDDRPANEDFSITAEGYLVLDLNLNYRIKKLTFGISVDNLLDTEWNETQFATESLIRGETQSVEEIHFTPGTPFAIRGKVAYRF